MRGSRAEFPTWAEQLAGEITVPRATGTAALERVTDLVAQRLTALGFRVERMPFVTSARRLAAVGVVGAGLGWSALLSAPPLVLALPAWVAPALGGGVLALAGLVAYGMMAGHLPGGGAAHAATNLVAVRGAPAVWLVAHLDTKSQRFSLRTRVVAAVLALAGGAGLVALLLARLAGPLPWWSVAGPLLLAMAGGALLSDGTPGDRSPGAVDNASGVLAALMAAERLARRPEVGVLITSAEELGMEGARAWVRAGVTGRCFVNFDGLDGRGMFRIAWHGEGQPLAAALAQGLGAAEGLAVAARLPPGVLVDGVALAHAGLTGVTVSRGDWSTLGVVHTPGDVRERLDLTTIARAAAAAAALWPAGGDMPPS